MASTAVSDNLVSSVVGYLLKKGYFNPQSPNLPQNISIFGQANTANQSGLSTTPVLLTSAQQAASLYGYGSPIHSVARILFPQSGGGVAVPVWAFPQLAAGGGVAKVMTLTPTGTATSAGTIYLNVAGRQTLDGASYAVNIEVGDTPTLACNKMRTALAAALGCPLTGSGTATLVTTAKFVGLESNDLTLTVDLQGQSLGQTYAVVNTTAGSGTATVTTSLGYIGNAWNTLVINTYGFVSATSAEFEAFNGIPDPVNPTGRYFGTIWKPLLALTGTVLDDPTSITSAGARPNNVTMVACPAPLSAGLPYEAAANVAVLLANIAQNMPQGDVLDQSYPDMPGVPAGSIPAMNSYTFRNTCATNGCSTVEYTNGTYTLKDLITTYNVSGEFPPFYRWVRDLIIHWNIRFSYFLLEKQKLVGKTISKDSDIVTASNVIKPKMWKADVATLIDQLAARGLIADAAFSKGTIVVSINATNPNRIDTEFSDKITGLVRISATTETGGFNFSN